MDCPLCLYSHLSILEIVEDLVQNFMKYILENYISVTETQAASTYIKSKGIQANLAILHLNQI
jgi:hypothetical protein